MSQGGKGQARVTNGGGPGEWRKQAACHGTAGLFFPEPIEVVTNEHRTICDNCPVFKQCFEWATFLKPSQQGICANTTTVERRRIRKASANGVVFEIDETAP